MADVFIYPSTSLILSDLVQRYGHTPLNVAVQIREHIQTPSIESPPLQMTPEDPKKGLKYAAVEVPAGVRGRRALFGPLIEQAEAAIIVNDADLAFGCQGCARTNELIKFMVREKSATIPLLDITYPRNEEEGIEFVKEIKAFLESLDGETS